MTDPTPQVWQSGERFFAIPKDVTLPEGDLELLGGLRRKKVDAKSALPYEIDKEQADELARKQVGKSVDTFERFIQDRMAKGDKQNENPLLAALLNAMPRQGTPEREKLAETLANGARAFAKGVADPEAAVAARERVREAQKTHIDNNPELLRAAEKFGEAVVKAGPQLAERLEGISAAADVLAERFRTLGERAAAEKKAAAEKRAAEEEQAPSDESVPDEAG
jgi:hypothetical protein